MIQYRQHIFRSGDLAKAIAGTPIPHPLQICLLGFVNGCREVSTGSVCPRMNVLVELLLCLICIVWFKPLSCLSNRIEEKSGSRKLRYPIHFVGDAAQVLFLADLRLTSNACSSPDVVPPGSLVHCTLIAVICLMPLHLASSSTEQGSYWDGAKECLNVNSCPLVCRGYQERSNSIWMARPLMLHQKRRKTPMKKRAPIS